MGLGVFGSPCPGNPPRSFGTADQFPAAVHSPRGGTNSPWGMYSSRWLVRILVGFQQVGNPNTDEPVPQENVKRKSWRSQGSPKMPQLESFALILVLVTNSHFGFFSTFDDKSHQHKKRGVKENGFSLTSNSLWPHVTYKLLKFKYNLKTSRALFSM